MSVHKRLKALEELVLAKGVSPEALTRLGLDPIDMAGDEDDDGGSDDGSDGYTFAAKLSNHPYINNPPSMTPDICGQIFYDHAMRLLIPVLVGLQTPTVYDVLAVVNAGVESFYLGIGMWNGSTSGAMSFAFRFLSFGVAMAKEIGLNRESQVTNDQGWITREHRRRVFWHLVMVDRVLCAAFNSEPLIPESEIQCDLPCLDAMWESEDTTLDRPTNIPIRRAMSALDDRDTLVTLMGSSAAGPGAYMALLNVIFGRIIVRHCLRRVDETGKRVLDAELENWMASLPARIRELRISPHEPLPSGRILDSRISFVFILWHTLKILLHGPWDIQTMARDTNWLLSPDFLVCAEHAEHISRTLEFIMKSSVAPDFLPPYLGLCILMAAFVHITLLRKLKGTGELEDDLRRRIMMYIQCLDQIGSRWRPVTSVAAVLRQAIGATDSGAEVRSTANWESGGRGLFSLAELAQEKVEEERDQLGSSSASYIFSPNVDLLDGTSAPIAQLSGSSKYDPGDLLLAAEQLEGRQRVSKACDAALEELVQSKGVSAADLTRMYGKGIVEGTGDSEEDEEESTEERGLEFNHQPRRRTTSGKDRASVHSKSPEIQTGEISQHVKLLLDPILTGDREATPFDLMAILMGE
ncbi:hypothetical protein HDU93_001390 [Gonapodya sp. JEL0774]|nr:hypothetical protein HDU93_001390 [Gonapodya sp. JEL0774]